MPEPVAVSGSNMRAANEALKLTPEEQNLYAHHLNMLATGNRVANADGSYSTVLSIGVGRNGREYNIPTVWDGKILPPEEAKQRAAAKGWDHWPSYDTSDEATARYMQMHSFMEKDQPLEELSRQRRSFANSPAAQEF